MSDLSNRPNRPFSVSTWYRFIRGDVLNKKNDFRRTELNRLPTDTYAVFVCFPTRIHRIRASHSSEFLNRKGLCSDIFSDNATNFVVANCRLSDPKNLNYTME